MMIRFCGEVEEYYNKLKEKITLINQREGRDVTDGMVMEYIVGEVEKSRVLERGIKLLQKNQEENLEKIKKHVESLEVNGLRLALDYSKIKGLHRFGGVDYKGEEE